MSRLTAILLFLCLGGALACNSTNPVAPDPQQPPAGGPGAGSYQISLTATPPQLVAGAADPSVLHIAVTRTDNGQPAPAGTRCAVSTSLGSFDAGRAVTLTTLTLDAQGAASASLYPGTQTGTASILAQIDSSLRQLNLPIREADRTFFVTSVTPSSGGPDGGTVVQITGAGFADPMRVTFGGIAATHVQVVSATSLQAMAPPPSVRLPVGQFLPVDVAATKGTTPPVTDTLAGGFIYANSGQDNQPQIFSVIPNAGPNDGGTTVVLRGAGFVAPVQVFFGGTAAAVTAESETQITVVTPRATTNNADRNVAISVRNAGGTGATGTANGAFRYGGGFFITSIVPTSGPYTGGTVVDIQGRGFQNPVEVRLGGVTQQVLTSQVSDTDILVTTAAVPVSGCNPPSGPVSVTNLQTGAVATSTLTFTYTVPRPQLTGVSPSQGSQSSTSPVTLQGSGFESAVRVSFGGVPSQSVTAANGAVTAVPPAFTGTFTTEPCDDNHDGTRGTRNLPTAVDVQLLNTATGCSDLLARAYTYTPQDASCRNDQGTTPPVANFNFQAIGSPLTVQFFDASSGSPTAWNWDFGDTASGTSNSSNQANPVHVFSANGTYSVRLTVSNGAGSSSVMKQVTVP